MTSLYKITEQHRELAELAELEDIPLDALDDTFQSIEGAFNEKAVSIIHVVSNMDGSIDMIDAEIKG